MRTERTQRFQEVSYFGKLIQFRLLTTGREVCYNKETIRPRGRLRSDFGHAVRNNAFLALYTFLSVALLH